MHSFKITLSFLILAGLAAAPFTVQAAPNGGSPTVGQGASQHLSPATSDPGKPAFVGNTFAPPSQPPGTLLGARPGALGELISSTAKSEGGVGVQTGNNSQDTQTLPVGQQILQAASNR